MNTIIVTGGAGFIGSNLVRFLLQQTKYEIVNVDKLTYAGNPHSLIEIAENPRYHFGAEWYPVRWRYFDRRFGSRAVARNVRFSWQ